MNDFATAYASRCKEASKRQGIDQLVEELANQGITATSEQTGGFTMCAYMPLSDSRYIYANPYGAGLYDAEGFLSNIVQLDEPSASAVAFAVAQYLRKEEAI